VSEIWLHRYSFPPRSGYASREGNRASAGGIFGRGLRRDRYGDGAGTEGAGRGYILFAVAFVAYGDQLRGELPVHCHYLDQSPLFVAVRGASDAETDMDQLRSSLHGVAAAVCDGMGGANATGIIGGCVLCRIVRVRRYCVQRF